MRAIGDTVLLNSCRYLIENVDTERNQYLLKYVGGYLGEGDLVFGWVDATVFN